MARRSSVPALLLVFSAALGQAGEATFRVSGPLPDRTEVRGRAITPYGESVLLTAKDSAGADRPYTWTLASGITEVANQPLDASLHLTGMTASGGAFYGEHDGFAAVLRPGIGLEHLPVGSQSISSRVVAASYGDAFGIESKDGLYVRPYVYRSGSLAADPLDIGLFSEGRIGGMSADGSTIVGSVSGPSLSAVKWNGVGQMSPLPLPAAYSGFYSKAIGVSENGETVLGLVSSISMPYGCLWTPRGFRDLGTVPDVPGGVEPTAMSPRGDAVVGGYYAPGGMRRFLWTPGYGMRDLKTLLIESGLGDQVQPYEFESVDAVTTPHGRDLQIVGSVRGGNGELQGFVATVPNAASFRGIGDFAGGDFDSTATAISADGDTIVGYGHGADGKRAFVWTNARGLVEIGPAAMEATGVSGDGLTVVGTLNNGGFRWREDRTGRYLGADAIAVASSADGAVTVGSSKGPDGVRHTYRWNGTGTERYTTYVAGHVAPSVANAVSADGATFAGSTGAHTFGGVSYKSRAFRWTSAGGQLALGDLPGGRVESEALGMSPDGEAIVGWSHSANGPEAFLWTERDGMRGLGDLPGAGFASRALAAARYGKVVVGVGVTDGKNHAFIWQKGRMYDLKEVLMQQGAFEVKDWTLSAATGVTFDAEDRIFVTGYGIDPQGHKQAFYATIRRLGPPPVQP